MVAVSLKKKKKNFFFFFFFYFFFFFFFFFFFKQKTAYEIVVRDWSSDVCSSDLKGTATGAFSAVEKSRCGGRNGIHLARRVGCVESKRVLLCHFLQ